MEMQASLLKKISLFTSCSVQHPESAPLEGIRCNRKSSSRELTSGNFFLTASVPLARREAPVQGWHRINVDGSSVEQLGQASVGVVIGNPEGQVVISSWRYLFNCASAEEVEFTSYQEGPSLAQQWCQAPMILETDCLSCIPALQTSGVDRSKHAALIGDAKDLMARPGEVRVTKARRNKSRVAQELAQHDLRSVSGGSVNRCS